MGATFGVACGAEPPSARVDQARLMATLRELPVARSALGDAASVEGLAKAESWVEASLRAIGYEPTLEPIRWAIPARGWPGQNKGEPSDTPTPRVWNNVIVEIPGREAPSEVLIVGAHFDAAPLAPGADDNGTGTAALMELARVLRDSPMKRTVRFVFFNLEEVGLVGSKQNAENLRPKLRRAGAPGSVAPKGGEAVVGMVSLEMLGYFADTPGSQMSPIKEIRGVFVPPTVGDFIAIVTVAAHKSFSARLAAGMIAATGGELVGQVGGTAQERAPGANARGLKVGRVDYSPLPLPDMLRSDHAPYLAMHVPAVMLTDTANFRNPNYHQPTDTVETIDADRFTLVVKGLAGAIVEIAGASEVEVDPKPTTGEDR